MLCEALSGATFDDFHENLHFMSLHEKFSHKKPHKNRSLFQYLRESVDKLKIHNFHNSQQFLWFRRFRERALNHFSWKSLPTKKVAELEKVSQSKESPGEYAIGTCKLPWDCTELLELLEPKKNVQKNFLLQNWCTRCCFMPSRSQRGSLSLCLSRKKVCLCKSSSSSSFRIFFEFLS